MDIYEEKCAVSACNVKDVLEAAHVLPYRGPQTNDISNGIILRADFHILFDEGLIAIDPESLVVRLSPGLRSNDNYAGFEGRVLHDGSRHLDRDVLAAHNHYCGF